jgi:hypothetical protein
VSRRQAPDGNTGTACDAYALVTPARNEEACIRQTIHSVLAQTVRPTKWVIVSDGSTDRTDDIVREFLGQYHFITLLRTGTEGRKDFGSKVKAFQKGYEALRGMRFDFIGNLDADVTFHPTYYEEILKRFDADPALGLAAGAIFELIGDRFIAQRGSSNSAAGSVQLFRRTCYESFGGYVPISGGGIDTAAEILARMQGWQVRTIEELPVYHHRRMTTGSHHVLRTRFRGGVTNYLLGYHPLFQLASCVRRLVDQPYVIGSLCAGAGYLWSRLQRRQRALSPEAVAFIRSEQLARLLPRPCRTARP